MRVIPTRLHSARQRSTRLRSPRLRSTVLLAAVAATALVATACSQNTGSTTTSTPTTAAPAASAPVASGPTTPAGSSAMAPSSSAAGSSPAAPGSSAPSTAADAGFTLPAAKPSGAKANLKIALVRQSGIGDYFEQWGSGAQAQLKAAGATVDVYDARNDNAKQATDFNSAIASKPDVIIVDHGLKDTIDPKVDQALAAGIPVVVYDVAISNQKAVYISQDDASIANKILGYMKQENAGGGKVAYVNVSGIAPLDSRDKVYQQFLKDNPTFTQSVHFGKYSESVAADTASEGAAALKSAPDTTLAFAAYDELAKGTLIALRQNNMTNVKVYGVDVSTADIQLMTAANSQWRATAATDPANVGAIVARAAIASGAGVDLPYKVTIPAALITQDLLKQKGVTDMAGLRKALPDLNTPGFLGAGWIPTVIPGG
ncbi:simple sugar transport system substrate-binding protein [Nakamurella sp. UYEF19]|uniref:sugar ABC transporter substrate-binding protein n=1 Tax=Nakamurella sp. UYEF19 TaxID=1756392 RepID=UPI00339A927A